MPALLVRSIRTKLPLTVAALILLVGVTISAAAFIVIQRTLHQTAKDRVAGLVSQFQETFRTSVSAALGRAANTAKRPELTAYLANPSPALEASAKAVLSARGPNSESSVTAELRDASGRVLLVAPTDRGTSPPPTESSAPDITADELARTLALSDPSSPSNGAGYSALRPREESMWYAVVARVPGDPEGYYVNWRVVSRVSQTRNQIAGILGSEAAFYIANADGTGWSELGRPVAAPSGPPPLKSAVEYSRPGKGQVVAAAGLVPGSPWVFTIEFPVHAVQAPARAFLGTVAGIASICIVLGIAVAWGMSRRLTAPLQSLTRAAHEIAAGQRARPVDVTGDDELGRLARSFNKMAADVEGTQQRLERLVEERTGELRSAKESLARREKLALVGHLAGGIGHEIRNPLGVMANAIYYLETIQPDAAPEVRKYLGVLREQVQLSAKIVNDLLDLSRTTPAKREPVSIQDVVDERLQKVPSNVAVVESDVPATLPRVQVDRVHAGQVLDNLLTNAVQALDGAPGTVRVRARLTGGFVRIEVSDTGRGIHADHISKIFEPLFTTKARGIGLGLALSKALARANGGDLSLVSGPGESATFAFTLPVAERVAALA